MKLMIYSKQFVASSINIRDCGVILLHDHEASDIQSRFSN